MFCFRIFKAGRSEIATLSAAVLTMGRSVENEIVLEDAEIPELAFRVVLDEDGCVVSAIHPHVKPRVNGKTADSLSMRPGDRLEVGSCSLTLDWSAEPRTSAGSPHPGPAPAPTPRGLDFREGMTRLCAMVAEERDLKTLLEKIMRLLLEAMGGDDAFLFTLDEAGYPRVFVSTRESDSSALFSDTVVREVLRTRHGMCVGNALSDPAFAHSRSVTDLRLKAILCCPILTGGKATGLVYLGSKQPSVTFGEPELRELEIYAMVAGCLINHVEFISRQNQALAAALAGEDGGDVVALCPAMKRVMDEVRLVAATGLSVLLQGETGTGKDVIANLIHRRSDRRGKPFLVVNCSTMRGELLASELFGHRKGAFTGALKDHTGLFLAASGGTLFLDEIGEMDLSLQAMLLRTLETGRVRPVGQNEEIQTELRVLCATNRNLDEMVAKGTFRQDLYYRINQHLIQLPPLRERGEDVSILAHHFLEKAKSMYPDKKLAGFHPDSLFAIGRYSWPGNVRELANAVHKAVIFTQTSAVRLAFPDNKSKWISLDEAMGQFQTDYLQKTLTHCGGDKAKSAAMLGIGLSTLFKYLAQSRQDETSQA